MGNPDEQLQAAKDFYDDLNAQIERSDKIGRALAVVLAVSAFGAVIGLLIAVIIAVS